ncbi:MAG: hypothetical protein ACRBK7_24135 [Acidimicrobiales bacterium]
MIASLIVGSAPLLDALNGNGPFENAMLRYLACLAVCVIAAATIGRMLDNAAQGDDDPNSAVDGPDGASGIEPGSESSLISDDSADGT